MQTSPSPLADLVKAVAFAAGKHRNQRRKDAKASPYINHPIALANVLASVVLEVTGDHVGCRSARRSPGAGGGV